MLASRSLHGAPSFRPCDRDRARPPRQGRNRVVAPSDRRGSPRRTRTPLAPAWGSPDRVALRLAADVRSAGRITIDVLSELQGATHWTDRNLEHLLLLRMANLSIQHGNTDASAVAYAYLNVVVGARFGQYAAGAHFGLLALDSRRQEGPRSSQDSRLPRRRSMGGAVGTAPAGGSAVAPRSVGSERKVATVPVLHHLDLRQSGYAWSRQRRSARGCAARSRGVAAAAHARSAPTAYRST